MQWLNEPPQWRIEGDKITVSTAAKTDFWRKTHYGFIRDSGHFFYQRIEGDFTINVKFSGQYAALYDQAGVMVRLDETTWMKCGVEYVNDVQQASVVVTRDFSDWSVVSLADNPPSFWLRVTRHEGSMEVYYSLDGSEYTMQRIAYLSPDGVDVGLMCASPDGDGFTVVFEGLSVTTPGNENPG
jgi:uncharacterized protein